MKIIYTDVLVIGGGLAGLRIGIGAKRRGHDVIILSLVPPKRSHSAAAQGGMQASLGNVIKGEGDNEDVHFEDTVRGSDWGADQQVVRDRSAVEVERRAGLKPDEVPAPPPVHQQDPLPRAERSGRRGLDGVPTGDAGSAHRP